MSRGRGHAPYAKSRTFVRARRHQTELLLKQQIMRHTLHCGGSESFLIKFRREALDMTHTLFVVMLRVHLITEAT